MGEHEVGHDQERWKSCSWAARSWMEIEGTVPGKRLSIKYVAIYLVEIIYHLKKFDV